MILTILKMISTKLRKMNNIRELKSKNGQIDHFKPVKADHLTTGLSDNF